jgi:deferrochelatase/peroxidase EfeB
MAARARVLGDQGEDAPEKWELNGAAPLDAVVLVYGADAERLEAKLEQLTDVLDQFGLEYDEIETYLDPDRREHFGFRFAQQSPQFKRVSPRRRGARRWALGELLLGYEDETGERAPTPTAPFRSSTRNARLHSRDKVDLGHNGTYLVLRQIEQRVAAFWASLDKLARNTEGAYGEAEDLAARLIGRKQDGSPLGTSCPLGAHVSRVNPGPSALEPAARPLLRRGRLYGPRTGPVAIDDGVSRGMMFVALTPDLSGSFEFVQQNQINNPKFSGLRGERDPLLGQDDGAPRLFTLKGEPIRCVLSLGERPLRVRGGEYFFLPSLLALGYLSEAGEAGRT